MNTREFYDRLYNVSDAYHWGVSKDNKIVATIMSGPFRGFELNPLTALAHKSGYGLISNTREGTEFAASLFGLPRKFARNVHSATLGTYNRGNTQVVRGRIRSALEV
jgi:hypothetical protein